MVALWQCIIPGRRFPGSDQRGLAIKLEKAKLGFSREQEHIIYYNGTQVGTRRADFIVENKVVVELKAIITLEDVHIVQTKNYTVAYDYPHGLLINFGGQSLQYKLIFNPKYNLPISNN